MGNGDLGVLFPHAAKAMAFNLSSHSNDAWSDEAQRGATLAPGASPNSGAWRSRAGITRRPLCLRGEGMRASGHAAMVAHRIQKADVATI